VHHISLFVKVTFFPFVVTCSEIFLILRMYSRFECKHSLEFYVVLDPQVTFHSDSDRIELKVNELTWQVSTSVLKDDVMLPLVFLLSPLYLTFFKISVSMTDDRTYSFSRH